jgi:hypothetical protein
LPIGLPPFCFCPILKANPTNQPSLLLFLPPPLL